MTGWNLPPGVSEFDEHINPSDDESVPDKLDRIIDLLEDIKTLIENEANSRR